MDAKDLKVGQKVTHDYAQEGEVFTITALPTSVRGHAKATGSINYPEPVSVDPDFLTPIEELTIGVPDTKDTNPKDAIGSTKLPLDLVPDTLKVMAALAFTEGATKYGAYNWRVSGVRASIYKAALERHFAKWWNGEDADPVTGVPHLASVLACAGIVLDANIAGKLNDDRPPAVPMSELIDALESKVKHLKELHADKNPVHYTEAGLKASQSVAQ